MLLTARPLSQPPLSSVRLAGRRLLRHTAFAFALVTLATPLLRAQSAKATVTLSGTVKDISTGAPVPNVNVRVPGIGDQVATNESGVYSISGLPMNIVVAVEANRLGYGRTRVDNVKLNAAKVTQDLTLNANPLTLQAVTTAGLADATSAVRVPIAISRLDADMMPVPVLLNSVQSIQGKVPGVDIVKASGAPQDTTSIQIRSIGSPLKNNSPLIVVDGVPLSELPFTSADFSGLDIESIEVIPGGANAAAAYGSRASGGVILITSKRAKNIPIGTSQLELRQDMGIESVSDMPDIRKATPYLTNASGQWIDLAGNQVLKTSRVLPAIPFQEHPFGTNYDPVSQALNSNASITSRVSIAQASQRTNLNVSFNRANDPGLLRFNKGARQNTLRFFLGHQLRDELSFETSVQHTRGSLREPQTAFPGLFETEPDVNLLAAPNPSDKLRIPDFPYAISPDSATSVLNPLYYEWRTNNFSKRQRTVISSNLAFRPLQWLSLHGSAGYDRADLGVQHFTPPGLPDGPVNLTVGSVDYSKNNTDGLYGDITASVIKDFGRLNSTLTLKAHDEKQNVWVFTTSGQQLSQGSVTISSATILGLTSVKDFTAIENGSANLGLDYSGRYIADLLVLREGNSRFGPEHHWNNYFRTAGAWLLNEESWFPSSLKKLTLAKLRGSVGSAGNQPTFFDQYDNIVITPNLGFFRDILGNPNLKPERKLEFEAGADLIWNNRTSLQLTYSQATVNDAILSAVAPSASGFATTQSNVGKTKGSTLEATLEATWINTKIRNNTFRWRTNFVASHSKSTLETPGQPCSGVGTYHTICDDATMTSIWGYSAMRSLSDLDRLAPSFTKYRDQWEVNDDGYLVPVGAGNHWYEGKSKNLWGTTVTFLGADNAPKVLQWGIPQYGPFEDTPDGQTQRNWHQIGDSQQKMSWGLGNRFNYGNLSAYVHFRGAVGGDIWNAFGHNLLVDNASPVADQLGKADSLKKPLAYYGSPISGDVNQGLGAGGLVENATLAYDTDIYKNQNWVKLGELNVAYAMDSHTYPILHKMGAQRLNFQISGRDLLTFKGNYPGLDPEAYVARGNGFFRFDSYRYPPTRNFTGSVTIVF